MTKRLYQPAPCFECGLDPNECRCGPIGEATSPYLRNDLRTEAEVRKERESKGGG